jgi:hypothetical protein
MKVKCIKVGFYGKLRKKGEVFELKPYSDNYIISCRKEESTKKVSSAERKADVELQFSTVWMKAVEEVKTNLAKD